MGIFATNKNQITLIYNSETSVGKQIYSYVVDSKREVRTIDSSKTSITPTQWVEISKELGLEINQLINKEDPDFKKNFNKEIKLENQDWLKIIVNNPELIKFSILIIKNSFYILDTPSDFLKFTKDQED
ncbi:arsenate reductase family protein [Aquimarina algicola]|uniref:Arsenate reductase n=1 Tax=Aquimarina algicola TaxID=2589995 RepID=A0A504J216_9FLAO|nr:hypothetical protein [Aquimarina algicola]TPN84464.1 hypothetical protein FHK87_16155 [Aquimarina algicola]